MDKNLLLARSNLRKAKGQTAAIVVLVLLASMMMNLWLMLGLDYKKNFDRTYDRLNDGHVNIAAAGAGELEDFAEKLLNERGDVTEFCFAETHIGNGSFDYNGGEINTNFIFLDKETALSRKVGRIEITEDSGKSGLYLPLLYSVSYAVGDEIALKLGNETLKYTVCGFTNSASVGSHNCVMCAMVLSEDEYGKLSDKLATMPATLISLRLDDVSKSESAETEIKDALLEEFPNASIGSNSYATLVVSRYISQTICAAILSAMALLITLIAVVVISSNVMNYVQENMQNLGALKAIGYKSSQLISAQITQFSLIALVTSAVGTALSYLIFPSLNDMMISQTGIPYEVRFLPLPCVITLVFMTGVIAAAVYLSAKRIRKIEPIMALRNGVRTHSFKKNRVPLDKTGAPLNFALALKNVLSEKKRNITVAVTMLVLSLVIVFSGVMLENFVINQQSFIDIIVGVSADSCIGVAPSADEELRTALENDERTEKFYLYTTDTYVTANGGASLMASVCDDCSKIGNQNAVVEGRFPKFDNEVAVAIKYAREEGVKVGDEISLKAAANEEKYIVSGFTQLSNNLGKDCLLTREGMERISEMKNFNYYVDVKDGVDVDKFNEDVTEGFSDKVSMMVNQKAILDGSGQVYISLVTMIVIAVLILSAVIVLFVLYLLVRTMLASKKRDYGIYKALGFTTGQLVLQTAYSFMPALTVSAAVGIILGSFVINPLLALFLGGIGIVKCTFSVPIVFNVIAGAGLILFAFGAACLLSSRIKKIAPRELLAGE
ncbi:MAG: FtsX-like permease family protein [Lachnospiraceae bacterium]|nr:FtsX-like permease family protein [Lachnospiraceae bacterium]